MILITTRVRARAMIIRLYYNNRERSARRGERAETLHACTRTHALRSKKVRASTRRMRRVRTNDLQIVYQIPPCASDRAAIGPFDAEIPAEYRGVPRVRSNVHTKRTHRHALARLRCRMK